MSETDKLIELILDENVIKRNAIVENERSTAVRDLLNENTFKIVDENITGPYILILRMHEQGHTIIATVQTGDKQEVYKFKISMKPMRRIIKDYMYICESYYETMKGASAAKIENVDKARRGLHDEGAEMLEKIIQSSVIADNETVRRLFTLITVMHIR